MYLGMGPQHTTVVAVAHKYPTVPKPNATQPQIPAEPQPLPRVPKSRLLWDPSRATSHKRRPPHDPIILDRYWYAVSYGDPAIYRNLH